MWAGCKYKYVFIQPHDQRYGVSLVAQMVKNLPGCRRPGFDPWIRKIPWRREWLPTPAVLPGDLNRQRSLTANGVTKVSDMTERLTLSLS